MEVIRRGSGVRMLGLRFRNLLVGAGLFLGTVIGANSARPLPPVGECPQPRFTGKAPDEYYRRSNPLPADDRNVEAGRALYRGGAKLGCAVCHGDKGDGRGRLSRQFDPPPRNFACAETVNGIPDGQLFWIIRFGSPGTSMPPHPDFSDEQVWQLVLHLRRLAG
ncbi:MAG: c-type cytochrome [Burkholderiales bacterium]